MKNQEKIEKKDLAWRVPGVVEQILTKLIRLGFVVKVGSGYRGVIPGESKKYN
jgi:predicted membrane-bound dolichyl-phosphate-mannose-protein mannosyltransferase